MTAIAFTVEFYVGGDADPGLRRLSVAFERAGAEVANLGKHVFPRVVTALEEAADAQFAAEGGGTTGAWRQLSAKYAEWKSRAFPGMPILQRTTALREGLVNASAPTARRDVTGDALVYGTQGVDYASFHQTGTGRMPARPPVDLGPDFEEAMLAAAHVGVRDAVREGSDGLLDFEGDTFDDAGVSRQVMRGARGGAFFQRGSQRVYLRRRADGSTVQRTFGGAP